MAERQEEFAYTPNLLNSLEKSLSAPRFGSYVVRGGGNDKVYALDLYLFNARLAKALLFPLHVAEVTVRNAGNEILVKDFGSDWPGPAAAFRTNLPAPHPATAIDKAVERLQTDGVLQPTTDQIVATLTFDFWSNLFRSDYDRYIWQTNIHAAFPNLPQIEGRPEVQKLARSVNRLRNKVAHHESLLDVQRLPDELDIPGQLSQILKLIALRCKETAKWTKAHSTVGRVLRDRPTKHVGRTGQPAIDRAIRKFETLKESDKVGDALEKIIKHQEAIAVVELTEQEAPFALLSSEDVARWLSSSHLDGYVCLSDGTIKDVLQASRPRSILIKDKQVTVPEITQLMYEPGKSSKERPSAVIITEGIPPTPVGIILRPHTRLT
ncbi:MAG: hypothetical protein E6Q98_01600 [Rhodospirillaceae bacterium]|nr:MAG: hypothetical protein E6Q98_01600 [Rhodospirillaceae bacterium]